MTELSASYWGGHLPLRNIPVSLGRYITDILVAFSVILEIRGRLYYIPDGLLSGYIQNTGVPYGTHAGCISFHLGIFDVSVGGDIVRQKHVNDWSSGVLCRTELSAGKQARLIHKPKRGGWGLISRKSGILH
jgi:hypothetical protein